MSVEEKLDKLLELTEANVKANQERLEYAKNSSAQKDFYEKWEFWFALGSFITLWLFLYTNAYSMNGVHVPVALANALNSLPFPNGLQCVYGLGLLILVVIIYTAYRILIRKDDS